MKCYQDGSEMRKSFINLPLPQDEVTRQNKYFKATMTVYGDFTEKVERWLSEMGHLYVQPKTTSLMIRVKDNVNNDDSASNV